MGAIGLKITPQYHRNIKIAAAALFIFFFFIITGVLFYMLFIFQKVELFKGMDIEVPT